MPIFMMILLMFVSMLLIVVILLQRGRGGGLVGALSGLGGQSAFGTKAGDTFTRITIGIAAVWVLLAGIAGGVLRKYTVKYVGDKPPAVSSLTKDTGASATSAIDDTTAIDDGLKETGIKGTKSEGPSKSDGASASEKRPEESTPDADRKSSNGAKSEKAAGGSKAPAKKKSNADKSAPVKEPDSAEKPDDSK